MLDVGDGQRIHWELHGNPDGIPVVLLHGGPGAGGPRGTRKLFDQKLFRVTLFDQRGCGKSLPNVADPAVGLDANTTWHLVDDIERLRVQVGVERWLVYGGSWGSTLALAYAQRHPDRVSGLFLMAVTTSTPDEIDWLYRGAGRLFPEAWDAFRAGAGDIGDSSAELIAAYGGLISSPDPRVRERAAYDWCTWEDALIAGESAGSPGSYSRRTGSDRIAFVRLCAHYFGNQAWLSDGQLLADVGRISGVPGRLVHGRNDIGCPPQTAWELAKAWPAAQLALIDDAGHTGSPAFAGAMHAAVADFSRILA
ncbi:MAG: proline iminopeptidase [Mycobacterium sp.]|nr:proline iminopeptidase [Mycobacterium sp.]